MKNNVSRRASFSIFTDHLNESSFSGFSTGFPEDVTHYAKYEMVDGWSDRLMDGLMDGKVLGQTNGKTYRWAEG